MCWFCSTVQKKDNGKLESQVVSVPSLESGSKNPLFPVFVVHGEEEVKKGTEIDIEGGVFSDPLFGVNLLTVSANISTK
jgi:hypothetical protein